MYAHVLRKWSLAKYLIIQWLPVVMLLVLYWCHGAAGLHLPLSTPIPTSLHDTVNPLTTTTTVINYHQRQSYDKNYFDRLGAMKLMNINNNNNNKYEQEQDYFKNYRNFNVDNTILTNRQFIQLKMLSHNNKLLSFPSSSSSSSSVRLVRIMRSRKTNDHIKRTKNNNYYTNKNDEIIRRFQRSLPHLVIENKYPIQDEQPKTSITTKIKTKIEPILQQSLSPTTQLQQQRLNEKRASLEAIRRHRLKLQQLPFFHHSTTTTTTNNIYNAIENTTTNHHHYHHNRFEMNRNNIKLKSLPLRHRSSFENAMLSGRNRRESRHHADMNARHSHQPISMRTTKRRFCSARDPTTLAFEAPTVFEGKVRSMSSDRRRNFSVTFEVKEVYKRQLGYKLPLLLRLQFSYRNNSECDIYKETMRSRGLVRDELEQGKVYILFVEQIDLGNYTILGQPIKKTKKVVNDVKIGVSEKYGEFD